MLRRLAWLLLLSGTSSISADEPEFKLPPGFKISQFSDEKLANDIYSMALDAKGRVHVSSAGWVKRLDDTNGDGKADEAKIIAKTRTGAMGMLFDEQDLYLAADEGLIRLTWPVDPTTLGEPGYMQKTLYRFSFGEHGAHAIRKGPDGKIYVIVGNNAGLNKLTFNNVKSSTEIEGGGIFSFHTDKNARIYGDNGLTLHAHGFRNPYDFDFTPYGDLITCDSDTERDFLLPWYVPMRLFHIGHNQHHGWRGSGGTSNLPRPDYYPETVNILQRLGRGSPTGVVCYRHTQFPEKYRNGFFTLDWTFGNIWFHALTPSGTSYHVESELFLQPTGNNGFAPTDVCVAPDGSLYVSIGGRGTRGSVYRIEYTLDGKPVVPKKPSDDAILRIVDAVQPLEPWSRAEWLTKELIEGWEYKRLRNFLDEGRGTVLQRIRAVEALTEEVSFRIHDRKQTPLSDVSPLVRARVAWGLGYRPELPEERALSRLASDPDPRVRVAALEAFYARKQAFGEEFRPRLNDLLGDPEKRVRLAALTVASSKFFRISTLNSSTEPFDKRARWTLNLLAPMQKETDGTSLFGYLPRLDETQDAEEILNIVRLAIRTFGDWNTVNPPAEVYSAYTLRYPPKEPSRTLKHFTDALKRHFPSKDHRLNMEISRFLGMIADDDPTTVAKLLRQISSKSDPTDDVHYLIVLSRLGVTITEEDASKLADAIMNLSRKLKGAQSRVKQNWDARLGEVILQLLAKAPTLAAELLTHPRFVDPVHVGYALLLEPKWREQAARFFIAAVKRDAEFEWSPRLVELLGVLPPTESHRILRGKWSRFDLRDAILSVLSRHPNELDRGNYLAGLESSRKEIQLLCIKSLEVLEPDASPAKLVQVLRLLNRSLQNARDAEVRAACVRLINRQAKQSFSPVEGKTDLAKPFEPIFVWFEKAYPNESRTVLGNDPSEVVNWKQTLATVKWEAGDRTRGEKLFQTRTCANCHQHGSSIGPDLNGVAKRFSREDLFNAILFPDRDVNERSRLNEFELVDGTVVGGLVAFESADAYILQIDGVKTRRLPTTDVRLRRVTTKSPMPSGLLKDMKAEELADLYQYLRELKSP